MDSLLTVAGKYLKFMEFRQLEYTYKCWSKIWHKASSLSLSLSSF
jgi:hypothetical protein